MDGLVQILEDRETQCSVCGKGARFRSLVLRDTKPHKVVTVKDCTECKLTETTEDDYETLDYGVRISCDFARSSDFSDDLGRMAFINSRAEVSFYENGSDDRPCEIFSFSTERSSIDCIEGLVMRGEEILRVGHGSKEGAGLKDTCDRLKEIRNGKGFKMVIVDNTGYSRVCPVGTEYTEVQDHALDELSGMDPSVLHEKIPKAEK